MTPKQKKILADAKKLPIGMQKVLITASKCVNHLMKTKGMPHDKAEAAVLEIVKESESYLKAKMFGSVCASLEMIFMDKNVEDMDVKDILDLK